MAKDPDERFQTPEEVAEALSHFVGESSPAKVAASAATRRRSAVFKWLCGAALIAAVAAAGLYWFVSSNPETDSKSLDNFLTTGVSGEPADDIVRRLLRKEAGRQRLRKLGARHPKLAYTEGQFARGYTSVAAFAYENPITGVAQPELCVIGWSPTTSGMKTCVIHDPFSVEVIDFDNAPDDTCLATLQFRTPDDEKLALGLKVHSLYETEIPLNTLIEGQVSMTDEFKKGAFLRSAPVAPRVRGPNVTWPYKFEEIDGNATLDTDRLTVVFEGEKYRNRGAGSLYIGGLTGPLRGSSGELSNRYSNGVCKVKFRTHVFRIFDGGNLLSIQETEVDLSQTNKVVTVKKDGSIIVRDK